MESHKVTRTVLVLTCLPLLISILSVSGFEIELYSGKDRRGQSTKIDVNENDCSELPLTWQSGVSSVDTLGNCVQFYDEPNCEGSLAVLQPFHIIHQMDLSLVNYANRIRTVSPCGPKLKGGQFFVVQNAADASVMAALNKNGNFAKVFTMNATKAETIPKSQQWEVIERANNEYTLKPRENSDNYPVSFDEDSLKKGVIKRKTWSIMSVGRGRYILKDSATQRCIYKTNDNKVEEHSCRIWSTNQEWVFRKIVGDVPTDKPKTQVGNGLNFNILSNVATSRPPTRPLPQYYPIHFNATKLAAIKHYSTASPYTIKKKIKRGPRPKSKYIDEPALELKPPGLRPKVPQNVANSNNYLLFIPPNGIAKDSYLPEEFVPSDDANLLTTKDKIKSTQEYKKYVEIVKQYLADQALKNQPDPDTEKREKTKVEGSSEDDNGGEELDEELDTSKGDDENNSDESVSEATSESQTTDNPSTGKKKDKNKEGEEKDIGIPPPSTDRPGFMSQVFTKFKSNFAAMMPTVEIKLPKIQNIIPSLAPVPFPKSKEPLQYDVNDSPSGKRKKKHNDGHHMGTHGAHELFSAGGSFENTKNGYTFSYSAGPGMRGHKTGQRKAEKHALPHRLGKFSFWTSSTTTEKPLTLGSWGIFG